MSNLLSQLPRIPLLLLRGPHPLPLLPNGSIPKDAKITDRRWTIEQREVYNGVILTTLECILELCPSVKFVPLALLVPMVTAGAISLAVLEECELSFAATITEVARAEYRSIELVRLNRLERA
jgi:hypothetical protein